MRALAAKASGYPVGFFKLMPRGNSRKIALAVREFLFSAEQETVNHILHLETPIFYEGKEYVDIDLTGVADLTSMHESAAENRLLKDGFVVLETSTNYLYACTIAGMATKLPEDFFTALPIQEGIKLKNAINDPAFFE